MTSATAKKITSDPYWLQLHEPKGSHDLLRLGELIEAYIRYVPNGVPVSE
mgnify:CR=1 FL=1